MTTTHLRESATRPENQTFVECDRAVNYWLNCHFPPGIELSQSDQAEWKLLHTLFATAFFNQKHRSLLSYESLAALENVQLDPLAAITVEYDPHASWYPSTSLHDIRILLEIENPQNGLGARLIRKILADYPPETTAKLQLKNYLHRLSANLDTSRNTRYTE